MIETLRAISPEIILIAVASLMYLAGTFAAAPCRCWFWTAVASIAIAGLALGTCAMHASLSDEALVRRRIRAGLVLFREPRARVVPIGE